MSVELVEHVGGVPRGISELERRALRAGGWRADDAIGPRRPGTEGSWNSTGPSRSPSPSARSQRRSDGSSGSFSRLRWVMNRLAFTVTMNPAGVCSRQRSNVERSGSR